jgi:tRNA(Ile)-lysidine synthase
MFKLLCQLPNEIFVACSGGVDSIAIVDFLSKTRKVTCVFFHHGTRDSDNAEKFLKSFCEKRNLKLIIDQIKNQKPKDSSPEEHWRTERYKFLESLDGTVVTAHNLDDCVETYLHSSLHGNPKVIPLTRNNIVRPFITTPKSIFINWCKRKEVPWCEDASNKDTKYTRNYIRHELMPHVLKINPGIFKTVRKIIEKRETSASSVGI